MKKKALITVSIVTIAVITCLAAFFVSASDALTEAPKTEIIGEKVYYAYYNNGSGKGAVAFCLNNQFVSFGTAESDIKLCTKQEDGTFLVKHSITKENIAVWFYGRTEYSAATSESTQSLLGGLSGIGITLDSTKTNIAFKLIGQELEENTPYYIYIPEDYFVGADGIGNKGGYIEITADKANEYSGNLFEDLKKATDSIYDAALFGIESVCGILG